MYGLAGCSLLAIFNGWRAFVTPFSLPDFIASYISVSMSAWLYSLSADINSVRCLRHHRYGIPCDD